jgi:hypothetical protein
MMHLKTSLLPALTVSPVAKRLQVITTDGVSGYVGTRRNEHVHDMSGRKCTVPVNDTACQMLHQGFDMVRFFFLVLGLDLLLFVLDWRG